MLAVNALGKDTCSSQLLVEKVGNIDATSFVQPDTLDRILRRLVLAFLFVHFVDTSDI